MLARRPIVLPPPRPYQQQLCAAANGALQTMHRVLAVSPTATGKTVCMMHLAADAVRAGHRVLVIVPAHLVEQTAARFRAAQIRTDTEKGAKYAHQGVDCVIASIDTLCGEARLSRWDPEHFGLVLVDEAHHSMAGTWQRAIVHFSMARVVGLTATPDRADGQRLLKHGGGIFDDVCFEYTIEEATRDGWLCPIDQQFAKVEGLDFTQVSKEARDLNAGQLDSLMNNAQMIKLMGDATARRCVGRQTVVFCVTVAHAYAFADYLRRLGCNATAVEGTTGKIERRMMERDFLEGRLQYLCNVDCLAEGWDCPPVSGIVMARPTLSRALYAQQIGRGLRLHPSKRDCLVLDFVGNSGKHCLVHAAHILNPDLEDRIADRASQLQLDQPELSVAEAIQLAGALERDEARTRLRHEVASGTVVQARFETVNVDPFDTSDTKEVFELFSMGRIDDRWGRTASPNQVQALERFGVADPEVLNRREASALLDTLISRAGEKRATLRQVRRLIAAGTHPENAKAMSFERAKQGLEELKANGWQRPESWGAPQEAPHPSLSEADTS